MVRNSYHSIMEPEAIKMSGCETIIQFTSEDVRHFARQNSNWSCTIFKIFRLLLAKIDLRRICCERNYRHSNILEAFPYHNSHMN